MKNKVLTLLLLGIIIAFGIYIYRFPPTQHSKDTICMNYRGEPMSQLDVKLIDDMVKGYKSNQLRHIESATGLKDAHSIWFDLETLKKFIYHIEIKSKNSTLAIPSEDLGLRFYYARYPEKETWLTDYPDLSGYLDNSTTKQYEKKHTLVIVPTKIIKGINTDFNPNDISTYSKGLEDREKSKYSTYSTITATTSTSEFSPTSAQNHGSLIPPGDPFGEGF